jgi:hypothetical protein
MKTNLAQLVCGLALLGAVTTVSAQSLVNLVANGSFENGTPTFDPSTTQSRQLFAGSTDVTGWTVNQPGRQFYWWNGSMHPPSGNYATGAADGNLFMYFNGNATLSDVRGEISTSVTFASAGDYTLTFDMASEQSIYGSRQAGFTADMAGLVSYTDLMTPVFSLDNTYPTVTAANWVQVTHDFTVTTPGTYVLSFTDASVYGDPLVSPLAGVTPSPMLDNVSITAAPEPSTLALSALGGLGLLLKFRRRK